MGRVAELYAEKTSTPEWASSDYRADTLRMSWGDRASGEITYDVDGHRLEVWRSGAYLFPAGFTRRMMHRPFDCELDRVTVLLTFFRAVNAEFGRWLECGYYGSGGVR